MADGDAEPDVFVTDADGAGGANGDVLAQLTDALNLQHISEREGELLPPNHPLHVLALGKT